MTKKPGDAEPLRIESDAARIVDHCAELVQAAQRVAASATMAAPLDGAGSALDQVDQDLVILLDRLKRATAELDAEIARVQHSQVDQFVRSGEALRLNIGPGATPVEGWVNVDLAGGDVIADIRRPLPFPDNSCSHVYCSHVLEHLRNPDESSFFLRECRRVLRRGGKLRVVVPDIAEYLRACVEDDEGFGETHQQTWPWSRGSTNRLDLTLRYAGAGPNPNDFFGHRHGYNAESLRDALVGAGFAPVRRSGFQQSSDEVFRIDDQSSVAHVQHNGRSFSLFAEAYSIF